MLGTGHPVPKQDLLRGLCALGGDFSLCPQCSLWLFPSAFPWCDSTKESAQKIDKGYGVSLILIPEYLRLTC